MPPIPPESRRRLEKVLSRLKGRSRLAAESVVQEALLGLTNADGTAIAPGALPAAGGDLSGTLEAATVIKLRGRPIDAAAPAADVALVWDGALWTYVSLASLGAPASRWEPLTNGDPDFPEILFDSDGDVLMEEVDL